ECSGSEMPRAGGPEKYEDCGDPQIDPQFYTPHRRNSEQKFTSEICRRSCRLEELQMSSRYLVVLLIFLSFCLGPPAFSQRHQPSPNSGFLTQRDGMGRMGMRGMQSDQRIDRALDTLQRTLNLSPAQVTSMR